MTTKTSTLICEKSQIAEKVNLFLEVMSSETNSISYSFKDNEDGTVTITFEVNELSKPTADYKLERVKEVQIMTSDYINSVSILQQMFPANEGYLVEIAARFSNNMFTSVIIVNIYRSNAFHTKIDNRKKNI